MKQPDSFATPRLVAWACALSLAACGPAPSPEAPVATVSLPSAAPGGDQPRPHATAEPTSTPTGAPVSSAAPSSQGIMGALLSAKADSAKVDAETIAQAVELWQANNGDARCPTFIELVNSQTLPPNRADRDPWGHPYMIVCSDRGPSVSSSGPDGKPGTADDPRSSGN